MSPVELTLRVVESVADIPAAAWDACATLPDTAFNPFTSHAFFLALEQSKSATARTGWLGQHLVLEDSAGTIRGVAPCYLKSHSRGEYVFDHGWADAYARAGGRYYPKLQACVPFTPVTGPRFLAREPADRRLLADGLIALCRQASASSVHVTFPTEAEWQDHGGTAWLRRTDTQFHWLNRDYASFEDFLSSLSARKRKNIRKERQSLQGLGLDILPLTGADLKEEHWDAFFAFYMETGSRKWGSPYLTRAFFSRVGEAMAEQILLILCRRGRRFIAGALNFIGSDALYGRNWGAIEHHPNLHFEVCYYQAIEFAIRRKLARVEAGAQGPHKLARGYLPRTTYSLHHLADPRLARAVAEYLEHERRAVAAEEQALAAHSPFKSNEAEADF